MGPEKRETKKDQKTGKPVNKAKTSRDEVPAHAAKQTRTFTKKVEAPKKAPVVDSRNSLQKRREATGIVVSDKMQKTIVVKISRSVRHAFYRKYVERAMKFKAHDEKNEAKMGDLVCLVESRPISRHKRWVLKSIIRKAAQTPEANV